MRIAEAIEIRQRLAQHVQQRLGLSRRTPERYRGRIVIAVDFLEWPPERGLHSVDVLDRDGCLDEESYPNEYTRRGLLFDDLDSVRRLLRI